MRSPYPLRHDWRSRNQQNMKVVTARQEGLRKIMDKVLLLVVVNLLSPFRHDMFNGDINITSEAQFYFFWWCQKDRAQVFIWASIWTSSCLDKGFCWRNGCASRAFGLQQDFISMAEKWMQVSKWDFILLFRFIKAHIEL